MRGELLHTPGTQPTTGIAAGHNWSALASPDAMIKTNAPHTLRHWGESVLWHAVHSRTGWTAGGAPEGADGPGNEPSSIDRVAPLPSKVFTPTVRPDRELEVEPELYPYPAGRSGGLAGWALAGVAASRLARSLAYESPHALQSVLGPSGPCETLNVSARSVATGRGRCMRGGTERNALCEDTLN